MLFNNGSTTKITPKLPISCPAKYILKTAPNGATLTSIKNHVYGNYERKIMGTVPFPAPLKPPRQVA